MSSMMTIIVTTTVSFLMLTQTFANDKGQSDFYVSKGQYYVDIGLKSGARNETTSVTYQITDRGSNDVSQIYGFKLADPSEDRLSYRSSTNESAGVVDYFINSTLFECLQNKVVLDVASGGGALVHTLRGQGIDAHGIDLMSATPNNQCEALNPLLPLEQGELAKFALFTGSATRMPYRDESVDRIISTWGPLSYWSGRLKTHEMPAQMRVVKESFREMVRVLKRDGMAVIGPIAEIYYGKKLPISVFDIVREEIGDRTDLHFYRGMGRSASFCSHCVYLIIVKGDATPEKFCSSSSQVN